jgi:hypothetical protein
LCNRNACTCLYKPVQGLGSTWSEYYIAMVMSCKNAEFSRHSNHAHDGAEVVAEDLHLDHSVERPSNTGRGGHWHRASSGDAVSNAQMFCYNCSLTDPDSKVVLRDGRGTAKPPPECNDKIPLSTPRRCSSMTIFGWGTAH